MIKIDTFIAIETKSFYSHTVEQLQHEFTSIQSKNALQIISKNLTQSKGHFLHGAIIVEIDGVQITSLFDWDDCDLIWPGFLTMVIDYLQDGFGETAISLNNIQWTLEKIITKPNHLVIFSSKHGTGKITKGVCNEYDFLQAVLLSAHQYLTLRQQDTRTQTLNGMAEKYNYLKCQAPKKFTNK
ncbi:hypothetical protein ACIQ1H_15165 [Lysinibacillus sp. NPDC097279]|uniref:hypothetical protein n=1 Tax=Lysinibacillus sp. NPDC097279 TaxID=3364143 RepID=UPI003812A3B8